MEERAESHECNVTIDDVQIQVAPDLKYDAFDIVPSKDRPTSNAIVDYTMSAVIRGAITVLMNAPDANPKAGMGDNILIRRFENRCAFDKGNISPISSLIAVRTTDCGV